MAESDLESAVATLRNTYQQYRGKNDQFDRMLDSRDRVINTYQPLFRQDNVSELTQEDFQSFLRFDQNTHWTGLHRQGPQICQDMTALREALAILNDASKPVGDRLDLASSMIKGMGKAIATAILLILWPRECGAWNRISEEALKYFDIWPQWERSQSLGQQYERINEVLHNLANRLHVDLWTLDALFWLTIDSPLLRDDSHPVTNAANAGVDELEATTSGASFGLERHLHEFLRDNWEHTALSADGWNLYSEPGDEEAGYEYPCDIGRIDLLARHRNQPRWLVVELKEGADER
jgi:hypothetical protein